MLGGLYLLTVAAGYQLDKLELVYSTRGFATGVSYTDQAAQFFAFDALTIVAGLVAALLVGGAFTRWIWPLGAGIAVWFGLSILLGRVYPEVIQRFTVEPNQYAQEQPYIANNIRMTRLAFDLDGWEDQSYGGDTPLTAQDLVDEKATFQNARLWDYRPLQTTLDQLQTVRQYYDFYDVDVDRYVVNDETRQVMLSARELAPERNPQAGSWVNQRIVFTHGFGIDHGPGQRGGPAGPAAVLHPRHAARSRRPGRRRSPSRGSTSASGPATGWSSGLARRSSTIRSAPATGPRGAAPRRRPAGRAAPASAWTASCRSCSSPPASATSTS